MQTQKIGNGRATSVRGTSKAKVARTGGLIIAEMVRRIKEKQEAITAKNAERLLGTDGFFLPATRALLKKAAKRVGASEINLVRHGMEVFSRFVIETKDYANSVRRLDLDGKFYNVLMDSSLAENRQFRRR